MRGDELTESNRVVGESDGSKVGVSWSVWIILYSLYTLYTTTS